MSLLLGVARSTLARTWLGTTLLPRASSSRSMSIASCLSPVATSHSALMLTTCRGFYSSPPSLVLRKVTKIKLKTHKGAAARFHPIANGEFKHWHAGRGHFMRKKSTSRKARLKKPVLARGTVKRLLKKLLPYAH